MFVQVLAAISLTVAINGPNPVDLVPGDGIALDPVPTVVSPSKLPTGGDGGGSPWAPSSPSPFGVGALAGIGALGAGLVATQRRRKRSMDPLFVVVHGNGGKPSDFDYLLAELGVDPQDAVVFDWRVVESAATSEEASRTAPTELAAEELDSLIRRLSKDHGNIYTLHHSKGGAAGVSMIAALDDGSRPPIDGYRGAALLDPAIASGPIGIMQRLGKWTRLLPDNGDFDPVRCNDDGCTDVREHLGEASGVEVIAIRNPDAVITNFWAEPEGLRVFDLVDDGLPSAAVTLPWLPLFAARSSQAHGSVLKHWAVVDCIKAEVAQPGSCAWKGHDETRSWWKR